MKLLDALTDVWLSASRRHYVQCARTREPETASKRRRPERDRILDILKEAEVLELGQESPEMWQEQRQEILRKRRRAAKDMQRKTGKALSRDMTKSRDEITPPSPAPIPIASTLVQSGIPATASKARCKSHSPMIPTPRLGYLNLDRRRRPTDEMFLPEIHFHGKPAQETQHNSDDESEPLSSSIVDPDEEAGSASGDRSAEKTDLGFAQYQWELP
ncbi:hypothetical protein R3P38DRAFT_3223312 [Favolaschia claudopus]|uniref:Uncharacterized protein n=1 Tax=Favolaschia claudopus TaxID=2862362 RepID=A0AAV9ZYR5_9AGAR